MRLTCNGITICRSCSPTIDEREIHTYHEILYCMDANAMLYTENCQMKVSGECLFFIPKNHYHYFVLQDGAPFSRLKISVPDDALRNTSTPQIPADLLAIRKPDSFLFLLLNKICGRLQDEQSASRDFYLCSASLLLLGELCRFINPAALHDQNDRSPLLRITKFISENLAGDLRVESLAKQLGMSSSYIQHYFKKEMGITVHRYIAQRRLILAHERIGFGEKPTKIYMDCGYGDYSSFYKAYCRFFGHPPSDTAEAPIT